jgi:hypothetical protein
VDTPGNFSSYTLRLVESPAKSNPPQGFDQQLSQVDFSFGPSKLSEFDCRTDPKSSAAKLLPLPITDYLAKDYASFRQLMLNRLTVTMPQWQERNPADLGVVLVELLAYAADHLSYYQDAVATEAYLDTARRRVSVRRHARLLDYLMHDGCNARAWVTIQVNAERITLPGPSKAENRPGIQLLTKVDSLPTVLNSEEDLDKALRAGAQVFETLHDITLYSSCNEMSFYTWGDQECYLRVGTTQATLKDTGGRLQKQLTPGTVLIFAEKYRPKSGGIEEANPNRRCAVRLTRVTPNEDPLFPEEAIVAEDTETKQNTDAVLSISPSPTARPQRLVEIEWNIEDALPFDLCIGTFQVKGKSYQASVASGNVVLVDQGRTIEQEKLSQVPGKGRYRPQLQRGPVTQQGYVRNAYNQWMPFDKKASASAAMNWEMRDAKPCIELQEQENPELRWLPQRDLLISERFDRHFVVEAEDDGRASLRFGDNDLGKQPIPGTQFLATYRIGNGCSGNVGAQAIAHIRTNIQGIEQVSNPMAARGGTEPESIEQVRLYAPQAFRTQKRAVTEADYAAMAQKYPGVQKATATRRWTGSWYTIYITVDREGGRPVDEAFEQTLLDFLEPYRLAGHDLKIDGPRYVPLEIALTLQVDSDYFQSDVKAALVSTFSNKILPNGQTGFFHPDHFSFGQPVYLSQVVARAMQVAGVVSVNVTRLQRWGQPPGNELQAGQITFSRVEIARLDNDPLMPENGRISFNLEGGL